MIDPGVHLFRREGGRLVATLTRIFGVHSLALAEDIVQDAFCRALEVWKFRGVPENPSAWLMATAKHRALDVLRRERTARTSPPELGAIARKRMDYCPRRRGAFRRKRDKRRSASHDVLLLTPRLAEEGQVALVFHILCGFSVSEIASAFVSSDAAERSASLGRKKCWRDQRVCSIYRATTISCGVFRQSSERSI